MPTCFFELNKARAYVVAYSDATLQWVSNETLVKEVLMFMFSWTRVSKDVNISVYTQLYYKICWFSLFDLPPAELKRQF